MRRDLSTPRHPRVSVVEISRLVSGWYHGGGFPFNGWRAAGPGHSDRRPATPLDRPSRPRLLSRLRTARPLFRGLSIVPGKLVRRTRGPPPPAARLRDGRLSSNASWKAAARLRPRAPRRRALREPGTVAVLTGQQAGLFGGPLFTLLKAVTAMRLARRLGDEHGIAVVPVFWVDAEDHDLDEIRGCHVLDGELTRAAVSLNLDVPTGTSASAIALDGSVREPLDALRAVLPATEFTAEVTDGLAAGVPAGSTSRRGLRPLARTAARPARAGGVRRVGFRPPSRSHGRCSSARSGTRDAPRGSPRRPARSWPRSAITRGRRAGGRSASSRAGRGVAAPLHCDRPLGLDAGRRDFWTTVPNVP